MGLTINRKKEDDMAKVTVDRKLWLTADKEKLVEDGDPDAAFLWSIEGREVPEDEAKRVGYKAKSKRSKSSKSDES